MFMEQDKYAQEAFVAYSYGCWSKLGLFCEREVMQEAKTSDGRDLT